MATRNRLGFAKNLNQENVKKVTTNSSLIPGQMRRAALGEIGNKVTLTRGVDGNLKSNLLPQKKHILQDAHDKVHEKPVEKISLKTKKPVVTVKVDELHDKLNDVQIKREIKESQKEVDVVPLSLVTGIEDIDHEDENNPMLVSIYSNDIHEYLRSLERKFPIQKNYLKNQVITPKMRCVLVDWLVEVHQQFHLIQETLYMTVSIIDRFLQSFTSITTKTLQLVGVTAMFIASKYEEMYSPDITDFVYITDNTYTKKDILQMELLMIRTLDYSFGRPLPLHFLRRYSKAGKALPIHHTMAKFFLELSLIHYELCHYPPSLIAAAAIYLAFYVTMNPEEEGNLSNKIWTNTLVYYSTYHEHEVLPVVYDLAASIINSDKSKYQSVQKKYALTKNMKVSVRQELRGPAMIRMAQRKQTEKLNDQ